MTRFFRHDMGRRYRRLGSAAAIVLFVGLASSAAIAQSSGQAPILTPAEIRVCLKEWKRLDSTKSRIEAFGHELQRVQPHLKELRAYVDELYRTLDHNSDRQWNNYKLWEDGYFRRRDEYLAAHADFDRQVEAHKRAGQRFEARCVARYRSDEMQAAQRELGIYGWPVAK